MEPKKDDILSKRIRSVQRCPRCGSLSLEHDDTGKIRCSSCGFEWDLQKMDD